MIPAEGELLVHGHHHPNRCHLLILFLSWPIEGSKPRVYAPSLCSSCSFM